MQLEKIILKQLFNERCFECGGFVFLKQVEQVGETLAKGIVSCPDCEIEMNMHFHLLHGDLKKATTLN